MSDEQPVPSESQDPLDALRERMMADARETCWCRKTRKPCEVHDAFEDGIIAVLDALEQVGWQHVVQNPDGSPRYCGLSEMDHRSRLYHYVPVYRLGDFGSYQDPRS